MTIDIDLCIRCVLPSNFPGVSLENGVCNYCRESSTEALVTKKAVLAAEIEEAVKLAKGIGEYDCIVAFSGGKDSSYTLMLLVEKYGLNCLAVTVDNGFVSQQAQANCKSVTAALGVDCIVYTPAFEFMRRMYVASAVDESLHAKSAIRRASGMCNSCINLINNYMLKTALHHGAPLIAGGYIGGQVPRDAAVLVIDVAKQSQLRSSVSRTQIKSFGPAATKYLDAGSVRSTNKKVTVINPMLAVNLSEEAIIDSIAKLGWVRTQDTGLNSSNCRLNDLGIAVHFKKHQFHPYVFELSEQVRSAAMSREAALKKVSQIPEWGDLKIQMEKLGLTVDSL